MLPTVDFCGLAVTRLVIGANPFGGFSHQSEKRDAAMLAFNTPDQILETWDRAWDAGINTMVANNETPHVFRTVERYLRGGGKLAWIAQVSHRSYADMDTAIDRAAEVGCRAMFFHGGLVDQLYASRDAATLEAWVGHARRYRVPIGVAGHSPAVHDWVAGLGLVDFHVVCFFNCGSLHSGGGSVFRLSDVHGAVECIRRLQAPCMAYKVMGAGRIDAAMALEYALTQIKPTDIVNVGMHRGDKDGMVEENAATVRAVLAEQAIAAASR